MRFVDHSGKVPPRPPVLAGFEAISSFYEASTGAWIAQVLPGDYYVTHSDEVVTTVLGSCVSTCIHDARAGVSGMNHFMLPDDPSGAGGASARYGLFAMEQLVNGIMSQGGTRIGMEVKVFGGGRVIPGMGDIGRSNVDFVREFLRAARMTIAAEDVGLDVARRVRFSAATGKVRVLHLPVGENRHVAAREAKLASRLRTSAGLGGEIDPF